MCISLINPCLAASETADTPSEDTPMPAPELLLFLGEAVEMDGQLLDAIEVLDLEDKNEDNNHQPPDAAASAETPGKETSGKETSGKETSGKETPGSEDTP
jgi:hypothetical protein